MKKISVMFKSKSYVVIGNMIILLSFTILKASYGITTPIVEKTLQIKTTDSSKTVQVNDTITSKVLLENKVGLNNKRAVKVLLPPGYLSSKKTYPVVYYLHSIYGNADGVISNGAKRLAELAFANNVSKEFILVVPDFSSPNIGSLYENSPVSGRWLDYITSELVPYIDNKYRTLKQSKSRAAIGDFMGGRGALQLGMSHSDTFGVIYALHPVATGVGTRPWTELGIDWEKILKAKTFEDLGGDKPCETFVAICQAFLPNPNRPPFYADFFMKLEDGKLKVDVPNMIKIQKEFMLEQRLAESVGKLQKLHALAFDWARYDGNFDHVYSARAFTRNLEDLGIEHEAEEYRGTPWNHTWDNDGRFYTRVLPFLGRHLVFD